MAKFVKDIVSVGTYDIPMPDGKRVRHQFRSDRLKKWASTASRMQESGLRIPAPFAHSTESVPVQIGSDGTIPRSDLNAGFWDAIWFDEERKTLVGVLDVPGSESDPNTTAGKIGKTIKDVSIYVRPSFTDGDARTWDDAIMHAALVTHPIQPGQNNFQPAENALAISMAFKAPPKKKPAKPNPPGGKKRQVSDDQDTGYGENDDPYSESDDEMDESGNPADPNKVLGSEDLENQLSGDPVSDVLLLLKEVAKIALPEDTNERNLLERLRIALTQKSVSELDEQRGGGTTKPPEGAQLRNAPFVMAHFTQQQVDAIIQAKVNNPETGKPFSNTELTAEPTPDISVIMSHPQVKSLVSTTNSLLNTITEQAKNSYKERVAKLIQTGRAGKEYAEAELLPMIDVIQMSFTPEGKPLAQPLDHVLKALEAQKPLVSAPAYELAMSHGMPSGAMTHDQLPYSTGNEESAVLTPDQMAATFARLRASGVLAS